MIVRNHFHIDYEGPYPFERWHLRGTDVSEPNNMWCDEHCAAMRIDLNPPMWNDFQCQKKFPFVCEIGETFFKRKRIFFAFFSL